MFTMIIGCQSTASDPDSNAPTFQDTSAIPGFHTGTHESGSIDSAIDRGFDTAQERPPDFPLLPAVPFYTSDRWILDANGDRFKLASVNWYGFADVDYCPAGLEIADLDAIAETIASMGFNSIRLPFSLEMVIENPLIDPWCCGQPISA